MALDDQSVILTSLGLASWRRVDPDSFAKVGELPDWWARFLPEVDASLHPSELDLAFFQNFLIDAELFWNCRQLDKIESGIWEHVLPGGGYLLLQLHAIKAPSGDFLVFQDVDATDNVWRDWLQGGRQSQLTLLQDISRRKQLELELRRAKETSERLEKAKSEFFAKTSHEIRTPLASILAMTEMALETDLSARQQDYIRTARKSAVTLLRIMNDVLDFSKIEHGSVSIEVTDFSLDELFDELRCDFQPATEERGIGLVVQLHRQMGTMSGDAIRLRQVLNNLVHNAIRFTDEGQVTVSAQSGQADRAGLIDFQVIDTGCGIPADQQQRIFESFVQGDAEAGLVRGGTGLGLSIASKLVELMGGQLQLTSEPGKGTTFFFALPRNMERSQAHAPVKSDVSTESIDPGQLASLTVLVAEDNPVNRAYACHVLTGAGVQVVEAHDGHEAVKLVHERRPDLVLMDCRMPDCDGIQATKEIRMHEREGGGHIPIVAVTAHAMPEDVDRCLAAGMDDYISKPFKKQELLLTLARLAGRSSAP